MVDKTILIQIKEYNDTVKTNEIQSFFISDTGVEANKHKMSYAVPGKAGTKNVSVGELETSFLVDSSSQIAGRVQYPPPIIIAGNHSLAFSPPSGYVSFHHIHFCRHSLLYFFFSLSAIILLVTFVRINLFVSYHQKRPIVYCNV